MFIIEGYNCSRKHQFNSNPLAELTNTMNKIEYLERFNNEIK